MDNLTISQLARAGSVGVETIRYYQRRDLLPTPERPDPLSDAGGSIRRYGSEDVRRLRFIRGAQSAGFTLNQIAELIELDASEDRERARELASERIEALDRQIAELTAARQSLQHLAKACGETASGPCPIIAAFEHF